MEGGIHGQDPIVRQCKVAQPVTEIGPAELPILQCPSTASSGRRLIAITLGGWYGFLAPECPFGSACWFGSLIGFRVF